MKPPKLQAHQISLKLNRYKRLEKKCKAAPLDDAKKNRKQELSYELGKTGMKV